MTKKYLELVGASTYTHANLGTVRYGEVVGVDNDDLYEELLEQGDKYDDGRHRPFFVEADEPESEKVKREKLSRDEIIKSNVSPTMRRGSESGDISEGDFGRKLQAPTGLGPNGAENEVDLNLIDGATDEPENKGQHKAYHVQTPASGPDNTKIGDGKDDSDGLGTGANKEEGGEEEGEDDGVTKEEGADDEADDADKGESSKAPATRTRTAQRKSTSTK